MATDGDEGVTTMVLKTGCAVTVAVTVAKLAAVSPLGPAQSSVAA